MSEAKTSDGRTILLRRLYLDDKRPWLVGFSGDKDSTLVAALVFDAVMSISPEQRKKPVTVLCTDTRVEIPAIAEGVESTLDRMRRGIRAALPGAEAFRRPGFDGEPEGEEDER